jgi:hypothetical protein
MHIKRNQSRINVIILAIAMLVLNSTIAYAVQCVDYIKNNYPAYSSMTGNANTWWGQTDKITQQHKPTVGSVLVFPGLSPLSTAGHVAYVAKIVSATEIRVNHANWNRDTGAVDGSIWTNVRVQDASSGKWTSVKMEYGNKGGLGSKTYSTYGFIVPTPPPTKVSVSCPSANLYVSQTSACSATAYYSNGTSKSVTDSAMTSWATNNSNASTITSKGIVTAKRVTSNAAVVVTVSYKQSGVTLKGTANLTVVGLDGKLPADCGCAGDQQSVASKAITGGSIVLMYSKKCGTNWTQAISTNSSSATTVKVTRTSDKKSYSNSGQGKIVSAMVYSPTTRVCASGKIGSVSVADNTVCK